MSAAAPLYPRVYRPLVWRRAIAVGFVVFLSACGASTPPAASPSTGAYDGRWFASVPPQGNCDIVSHLTIDVAGRSLTGHATNFTGVYPLSGSVDANGDGTFKIGVRAGKIKFSGDSFEANYSNDCGPRHAIGARDLARTDDPHDQTDAK